MRQSLLIENRLSTHLMLVHAGGRRRVVPVIAPGGMVIIDDEIAVVRGNGIIESQLADVPPILGGSGP
jgi:hypothetical protein